MSSALLCTLRSLAIYSPRRCARSRLQETQAWRSTPSSGSWFEDARQALHARNFAGAFHALSRATESSERAEVRRALALRGRVHVVMGNYDQAIRDHQACHLPALPLPLPACRCCRR